MILVTGGAGFIGSEVVRQLVARGIPHRILDDLSTGDPANLPEGHGELVVADLCDLETVTQALDDVEGVIHLAARVSVVESRKNPLEYERVNAAGTMALLQLAGEVGVRHVVLASTCALYGEPGNPWVTVDSKVAPVNYYGATKAAAETYLRAWVSDGGRHEGDWVRGATALRLFNVFGPRQRSDGGYAAVIPAFISRALRNEALTVYGNGDQTRDFVFVEDVADFMVAMAVSEPSGFRVYHGASGRPVSINQLAQLIEEMTGSTAERVYMPARVGEVKHIASQSKLSSKGLMADRLRQTVEWFRASMR